MKFDWLRRKYNNLLSNSSSITSNHSSKLEKLSSIYNDKGELVLKDLPLFKFIKGRYGLGKGKSFLILKSSGVTIESMLELNAISIFFFFSYCIRVLKKFSHCMDLDLKKKSITSFLLSRQLFTYKGWCFINKYPVNGQKRRSNYKTSRRMTFTQVLTINK